MRNTTIELSEKDLLRKTLAKKIKTFLEQGGQIQQCANPVNQQNWPIKRHVLPVLIQNIL